MLLWRCDFQWFRVPKPEVKEWNIDKKDCETTAVSPSGEKSRWAFTTVVETLWKLWCFFRFCCLLARPIGQANENTGTRTAHCLCQLPPGCAALHNPHRFWTGPLHPAPSHSVRSRRTSHGPHADCSFRLAIFELTRSTAFQPQEERRTASVSPFSHLEAKELTFSCPEWLFGKGWNTLQKAIRAMSVWSECNVWPDFGGLGFLFFLIREPNNQYTLQDFSSAFSRPWQAQTLIFRHPLSVPLLKVCVCFFKWSYLFLLSQEFLKDSVGILKHL